MHCLSLGLTDSQSSHDYTIILPILSIEHKLQKKSYGDELQFVIFRILSQ
jgi:hypothetical protein